jgi:hypothetical protein
MAGVMVRGSLDPKAGLLALAVESVSDAQGKKGKVWLHRRPRKGAILRSTFVADLASPSLWTRIERRGGHLSAFTSQDGKSWSVAGELDVEGVADAALLGVFADGGDSPFTIKLPSAFTPAEAAFSDLTVERLETTSSFRRGDSNADGQLDLSDGIYILNYLFLGSVSPTCLDGLDVDDRGDILITDAVYVFTFLFLGGGPPEPPIDCGKDPTEDSLGCGGYPACS